MKLLKDHKELRLNTTSELEDYLSFREKNDRWFISPVQRMTVIAGSGTPEMFKKKTGTRIPLEAIEECMKETNLFLSFYTEINGVERHGIFPLRYTAIRSVLDRAKIGGFSITNEVAQPGVNVLPLEKKAEIITLCLQLYTAQAKILYRDEEISSVMSGQYAILKERDIVTAVEDELAETFDNITFESGRVSHECFRIQYDLNADEIIEDITIAFSEAGLDVDEVKTKIGVFTSDIGNAAATVYSFLDIDGHQMLFGKPYSVKHAGKKTSEDIKKGVRKMYAMFKKSMESYKELCNVTITNPTGCVRLLAKEYHLPKKITMEVTTEMELKGVEECSAYEVFWYLNEIASRFEKSCNDTVRIMQIQEYVAETLYANYKKFDKPFEWARGESLTDDEE